MRFTLVDIVNKTEYQETVTTTTDNYGIVNTLIGSGQPVGGYSKSFDAVSWKVQPKTLVVDLDVTAACTAFEEISRQSFASLPFAFMAENISGIAAIDNGGTGASNAAEALTNLGAQRVSNLSTNINNDATSTTRYPAVKTVKEYVDALVSSTVPDASATAKGKLKLAGDLEGTAEAPTIKTEAITSTKIADNAVNLTTKVTDILPATNGGTGVNNGTKTITLGGDLTTAGNFSTTLTATGTTDVTLPTTGTLATTDYVATALSTVLSSGIITDATLATKGLVQLAGDLAGTAAAPRVKETAILGRTLTGYVSGAGTVSASDTVLGAIQKLNGNDALKAPSVSPLFTGRPEAPTANVMDTSDALATTRYVTRAVNSAVVGSSPETRGVILLAGDLTGNADVPKVKDVAVMSKVLTGFTTRGAGTVSGSDTLLGALQKLDGNAASKASLTSPVFIGIPTAPTPLQTANNNQLATTEYVNSAIATATPTVVPEASTNTQGKIQLAGDLTVLLMPL